MLPNLTEIIPATLGTPWSLWKTSAIAAASSECEPITDNSALQHFWMVPFLNPLLS